MVRMDLNLPPGGRRLVGRPPHIASVVRRAARQRDRAPAG